MSNELTLERMSVDEQVERHLLDYGKHIGCAVLPLNSFTSIQEQLQSCEVAWLVNRFDLQSILTQNLNQFDNMFVTHMTANADVTKFGICAITQPGFDFVFKDSNGNVSAMEIKFTHFGQASPLWTQPLIVRDLLPQEIPSVAYATGIFEEIAPVLSFIYEVLEIVRAEADQSAVTIRQAYVHRFTSREVPGYKELVITFFGDADQSKLVDFSPRLSECVGAWRRRQSGTAKGFADQLAVEIVPLEFWDHVRS